MNFTAAARGALAALWLFAWAGGALALGVYNKEEVTTLTHQALEQAKQGKVAEMLSTAKEVKNLARGSLSIRHSFVMQTVYDRLSKVVDVGEKGDAASAVPLLEEALSDLEEPETDPTSW
jgi:hypothetical protein